MHFESVVDLLKHSDRFSSYVRLLVARNCQVMLIEKGELPFSWENVYGGWIGWNGWLLEGQLPFQVGHSAHLVSKEKRGNGESVPVRMDAIVESIKERTFRQAWVIGLWLGEIQYIS